MPGDKVDMIVTGSDPSDQSKSWAQVMYQNVKILAIGTKTAPQAGDTGTANKSASTTADAASGLITFSVPIQAAQHIALAASNSAGGSSIYLALVPPDSQPVTGLSKLDSNNLFNGIQLTPYGDK